MAAAPSPLRAAGVNPAFARDVATGLTRARQKWLPASWLYDEVGSALFEVITRLPEYGLTRADSALVARSEGEIVRAAGNPSFFAELGSGSGTKTRHVLAAAAALHPRYFPIDISRAALEDCETTLGGTPGVTSHPIEGTYIEGIETALAQRRPGERAAVLFLGSTIGNFNPGQARTFLRRMRRRLKSGDSLLLGTDLLKPRDILLEAYDDPTGVTAAFNLNLLARMNRELDADFNVRGFAHEARFNERFSRVEMHLRSLWWPQAGFLDSHGAGVTVRFKAGETIWTESSHKFRTSDAVSLGRQTGFDSARQWIDREWGFAETLFSVS